MVSGQNPLILLSGKKILVLFKCRKWLMYIEIKITNQFNLETQDLYYLM